MPKVYCAWKFCLHNGHEGKCMYKGTIELLKADDVYDYNDEEIDVLQCMQYKKGNWDNVKR